jgi:hypothetical protein
MCLARPSFLGGVSLFIADFFYEEPTINEQRIRELFKKIALPVISYNNTKSADDLIEH